MCSSSSSSSGLAARFQYFSDVHLEEYRNKPRKVARLPIRACAPYLILAGDIGIPAAADGLYAAFLRRLSGMFERVFVVAGNHEYYYRDGTGLLAHDAHDAHDAARAWMAAVDMRITLLAEPLHNVVYLQNTTFDIPDSDLTVYGGTFWSHIEPHEEADIQRTLRDYARIPGFTCDTARTCHRDAVAGLHDAMRKRPDRRFVVISHHLPSRSLVHPRYAGSGTNSAYASEVPAASDCEQIVAWFAGHTHTPIELGKFHVNPMGYRGERPARDFNRVVDLALHTQ